MKTSNTDRTRALILLLFFLSGACTLVYEIAWVRMFVLVFGTSVYAVSTVLSAFMAGLALGSALFGRVADRGGNPLRLYAWLELNIGLFALVFPFILGRLDGFYTLLYGWLEGSPAAFGAARFALSFLVLLVPATLMGATLPVLSRFAVGSLGRLGRGVGSLYALNTFGAVAGCALTAFVLLELAGVRGATTIAALVNGLVAVAAFVLAGRYREKGIPGKDADEAPPRARDGAAREAGATEVAPLAARAVFWGFAISGFVALAYEVVWARLLGVVLRLTTSQSLSTILISFLFGLAVGGAVGARYADRWKPLVAIFAAIQLALGLFGLASIALFGAIPDLARAIPAMSWGGHLLKLFLLAFVVMLGPTVLMGLAFPVAAKIHARGMAALGRSVGNIYAANTAGAIFGAFTAGFVLIPLLGTQHAIQLLAWINLAVGVVVLLADASGNRRRRLTLFAAAGLPALLLTLLLPGSHLEAVLGKASPRGELIYFDETAGGTVTVFEFPDASRILRVNGAGEVPTDRASVQIFRMLGNLPMLVHPAPRDVLVIAFGGGITLSSVEPHRPRSLDCVEIVPGVFEAAEYFDRYNRGLHRRLDQGGIELIEDDGRNHVLRTRRSYDVIISDSTHPGTADSWVLYTQEFYRLCRERLNRNGLFAQWLPLHGLTPEAYRMILRTFYSVFPHASLWITEEYSILLGAPDGLAIDVPQLRKRLAHVEVREGLDEVNLDDPVSFLAGLALDERAIAAYVGDGPVNTDDRPWISFARRMRSGGGGILPITISLLPHYGVRLDYILAGATPETVDRIRRRLLARRHAQAAWVSLRLGDRRRTDEELRRARALDSTDPDTLEIIERVERSIERREPGGR
jgi:spermidine synthase